MKNMGDNVRKYARRGVTSTSESLRLLELRDTSDNICAGNLFMVALEIIRKQELEIERLKHENENKQPNHPN